MSNFNSSKLSSSCLTCQLGVIGYTSFTLVSIVYTLYKMYFKSFLKQNKSFSIFSQRNFFSTSSPSSPSSPPQSLPSTPKNKRRRTDPGDYTLPSGVNQILLGDETLDNLHREALISGNPTYIDPNTGFGCFTQGFHLKKKECCGFKCRHCPYEHVNVGKK